MESTTVVGLVMWGIALLCTGVAFSPLLPRDLSSLGTFSLLLGSAILLAFVGSIALLLVALGRRSRRQQKPAD